MVFRFFVAIALCASSLFGEVMLLMNYKKELLDNQSLKGYLVSEKFDGIRAFWDGKKLLTRQGKEIFAPECWIKGFPKFALDGELFIKRGAFEETLSIVSQKQADCKQWQKIKYYVFDAPMFDKDLSADSKESKNITEPRDSLEKRLAKIENFLDSDKNLPIKVIPQIKVDSENALKNMLKDVAKKSGEGLVIRKNNAPYEVGRTKNALKLKPYLDSECKVIAHNEGKGRLKGKLGSVLCEQMSQDGKILHFKIGSGFSDKYRENPPPIGSLITYKFYGYTKNDIPKFASFLRMYRTLD